MRELTSHKVNGLNALLRIEVLDEPGAGGACHEYHVTDQPPNGDSSDAVHCRIRFQKGPIQEAGVNGISIEALLAIVEHRLQGFQSGEYACEANRCALEHVQAAMNILHERTRDRVARGVEGTSQK